MKLYQKMQSKISNELSNRREYRLNIDHYLKITEEIGLKSQLMHLMNILFMKPGTIQSCPEMGIDLNSYQFEFATDDIIANINNKIREQFANYISPNLPYIEVSRNEESKDGKEILIIISSKNATEIEDLKSKGKYEEKSTEIYAITYNSESKIYDVVGFLY